MKARHKFAPLHTILTLFFTAITTRALPCTAIIDAVYHGPSPGRYSPFKCIPERHKSVGRAPKSRRHGEEWPSRRQPVPTRSKVGSLTLEAVWSRWHFHCTLVVHFQLAGHRFWRARLPLPLASKSLVCSFECPALDDEGGQLIGSFVCPVCQNCHRVPLRRAPMRLGWAPSARSVCVFRRAVVCWQLIEFLCRSFFSLP